MALQAIVEGPFRQVGVRCRAPEERNKQDGGPQVEVRGQIRVSFQVVQKEDPNRTWQSREGSMILGESLRVRHLRGEKVLGRDSRRLYSVVEM